MTAPPNPGPGPRCRSCGAEIVWARSQLGKRIPLDAEPTADGNVILRPDGAAIVLSGAGLAEARANRSGRVGTLHRSHFATCPQAGEWRKKPRPKPQRLDGCTCGGIGDTGSHARGCPWAAR